MLFKNMLLGLIKKHKVLFSAMTFVSALTIGFASGLLSSYYSFEQNSNKYVEEYPYPDMEFELNGLGDESKIENALKNNEGVEKIELSLQAQIGTSLGETHLLLRSINDDSYVKYYSYTDEQYNEEYPNIHINIQYAQNNNIKVGDYIVLTLPEDNDYKLRCNVSKIITSSSLTVFDLYHIIPVDKTDYGYCLINKSELKRAAEKFIPEEIREKYTNKTNRLIIKVKDGYSKKEVYDKCSDSLATLLKEDNIEVSYSRYYVSANPYEDNIGQLWSISFLIPLVFIVIALILIFLFMFQIVRSDTRDIGILNALGIRKKTICSIFVILSIAIGIIASLLGLGVGALVGSVFYNLFADILTLPIKHFLINLPSLFISIGVVIAILILASVSTFLIIKKISPIEVMVNKANRYKQLSKPIEKLTKNSSINTKLTINTIHKNISRFGFAVFTVALVYTIIFTALNFRASVNYSINQTYATNNFDAQVYKMDDEVSADDFYKDIKSIKEYVERVESSVVTQVIYYNGDKTSKQRLIGLKPDHKLFKLPDANGNECKIEEDGLILESELAKYLDVKIGDTVYLNNTIPIKLTGIYKLSAIKFGYVSYDTAQKITTENNLSHIDCALVRLKDKDDQNRFKHEIYWNMHYNVHTIFVDKFLGSNFEGFEAVSAASLIIIIFSILIALIVTTFMGLTILNEQTRKFSIMRTLGFSVSNISKQILLLTLTYLSIGIIIGIPIAIPVSKFALSITNQLDTTLYFTNLWWLYVLSIALVVLFIAIAHLISIIKVKKWNVVNNLKTRE